MQLTLEEVRRNSDWNVIIKVDGSNPHNENKLLIFHWRRFLFLNYPFHGVKAGWTLNIIMGFKHL